MPNLKKIFKSKIFCKIVLIILGVIAILGLAVLAWTLLDKSSPISRAACQQKVKQTAEAIKQANYCVENNDCVAIDFLGCGKRLVHKNWVKQIQNKIKSMNKWCVPISALCPAPTATSFRCNNGKCEFVEEKTKEVIIQTDKTEYQLEETINITIKNGLSQPIWYGTTCPVLLFQNVEGKWLNPPTDCPVQVKELKSNESVVFSEPAIYQTGKYKVAFDYNLKNPLVEHLRIGSKARVYSNEFEIQSVKQEVIVTTDKTEYQRGENIKITVSNNSAETVCYDVQKECGLPFWSLSKYQENCPRENCWQEVTQVSPCKWEDTPPAKQLKIQEKIEENWNQTIFAVEPSFLIEAPLRLVDAGKYRFEFEYWRYSPGCQRPLGYTPITLSNEFEIKEQLSQTENYCQKDEDCRVFFACPEGRCFRQPRICKNSTCVERSEGDPCFANEECQNIDCSQYDTSEKGGYKAICVLEGKCKCMCYGCK